MFPSKTVGNHQKNSDQNVKFGWALGIKNVQLDMIISDCIQSECVGHSKVLTISGLDMTAGHSMLSIAWLYWIPFIWLLDFVIISIIPHSISFYL